MVSPYLNRPLRSLEEVLRARRTVSAALVQETHASDPAPSPAPSPELAGSRKTADPSTLADQGTTLPTRREAA